MQPDNPIHPQPSTPVAPTPGPVLPPQQTHRSQKPHREGLKSILTTIAILLMAPILALSITAFVFQSYEVDGPSMQPTLETHDRLIVWKVGRTWSRITNNPYIPDRGSVIVFVKKGLYDFNSDKEKQLIKRVIGLPGDRVVVQDGTLTVYNSEHPDGFSPDKTMEYGKSLGSQTVGGNVDLTVGEDEIFVVGDNRDNSLDSRTFGTVPVNDIVGTLSARVLPLGDMKKF